MVANDSEMDRVTMQHTWPQQLRHAGLRVTKQRLAVLDSLEKLPHATAEQILSTVREQLAGITVQSIYTVIGSLIDAGLIRKVELAGSPARYEVELHDNHHHVVCQKCGRIEDVKCATGRAPCLHPVQTHGMTIHAADVVYQGICADCQ